jgi:hypothetical protein
MQTLIDIIKQGKFLKVSPRDDDGTGIFYQLNNDLYRTHEFSSVEWRESIVVFGCSTVFGLGLTEKETITSCLERITNRPVINMGVCGSSMQFSLYNSVILRNYYPLPKAVVHIWTSTARCTRFSNDKIFNYGAWNSNEPLMMNWASDQTNVQVHAKMTQLISKHLWPNDVKYHELTFFKDTAECLNITHLNGIDLSLDNTHPGKETAQITAECIAKDLSL